MMKLKAGQAKLIHIATGFCAIALPSAAVADTQSYVDLTGSAGYSRNPFLDQDGQGSVFGRVSASGVHSIRGERSSTNLSAFVENSTYLSDHGSTQIFSLEAGTSYQVSELVQLFGSAEFSGDIGGQLIDRFDDAPSSPPDPGDVPLPPDEIFDPDALNLNRRQYHVGGQLGTALTVSERDNLTIAASGRHVFFGGNGEDLDYTVASATIAWQRQLSERTQAGAQMSIQRANYPDSDRSTIFSPQLTVHTTLGVGWDADFAAGASIVRRRTEDGSDQSITPALDASVCRKTDAVSYCGRASYSTEAASQTALKTVRVGVDYFNRLNAKDTLQANVNLIRNSGDDSETGGSNATYYSAGASFGRKFSDRLSAGANIGARKVVEKGEGEVPLDLSASAFVRYRLGDIL